MAEKYRPSPKKEWRATRGKYEEDISAQRIIHEELQHAEEISRIEAPLTREELQGMLESFFVDKKELLLATINKRLKYLDNPDNLDPNELETSNYIIPNKNHQPYFEAHIPSSEWPKLDLIEQFGLNNAVLHQYGLKGTFHPWRRKSYGIEARWQGFTTRDIGKDDLKSYGDDYDVPYGWNHDQRKVDLQELANLFTLAFIRDSYDKTATGFRNRYTKAPVSGEDFGNKVWSEDEQKLVGGETDNLQAVLIPFLAGLTRF